jgi:hypothetical protein
MSILVSCLSCHRYEDRRDAVLDTWGKECNDLVIILGRGKSALRPKEKMFDGADYYYNHNEKMGEFFKYADTLDFDYLFKCDDDTYVHYDRLMQYKPKSVYIGCCINTRPTRYASGGAGYIVSRDAVRVLAKDWDNNLHWAEDIIVATILNEYGIELEHCDLFNWTERPVNDSWITKHYISPSQMRKEHANVKGLS